MVNRPEVLAIIPARGGSKGIPRKNVRDFAGAPLIAYSIVAALRSQGVTRVIVSTDDEEIAKISRQWGAEVPFMRPDELARDDSPVIDVMVHAIRWFKKGEGQCLDYMMLLQPTAPFRTAEDINRAISMAVERNAIAVISLCAVSQHPFLCKRILDDGTMENFIESTIPYLRRQSLPPLYALNGAIYLNRCDSLLRDRTFWPPGSLAYIMPPERSIDIDTPWDYHVADLILKDQQTNENDQHR